MSSSSPQTAQDITGLVKAGRPLTTEQWEPVNRVHSQGIKIGRAEVMDIWRAVTTVPDLVESTDCFFLQVESHIVSQHLRSFLAQGILPGDIMEILMTQKGEGLNEDCVEPRPIFAVDFPAGFTDIVVSHGPDGFTVSANLFIQDSILHMSHSDEFDDDDSQDPDKENDEATSHSTAPNKNRVINRWSHEACPRSMITHYNIHSDDQLFWYSAGDDNTQTCESDWLPPRLKARMDALELKWFEISTAATPCIEEGAVNISQEDQCSLTYDMLKVGRSVARSVKKPVWVEGIYAYDLDPVDAQDGDAVNHYWTRYVLLHGLKVRIGPEEDS